VAANNAGIAATTAQAEEALRAGNALLCFDILERAAERGLRAPELEYLSILSLAHCGSTQMALDRYHHTQATTPQLGQDWLALEGRLFKDLAQQGGAATRFMYERAAQSYWQAFVKTGGYFSAINAATMFALAGDLVRAQAIATDVLALTAEPAARSEMERYNQQVSQAEAALLLGDLPRCRTALRAADQLERDNRTARARTVRQFQLLCRHLRVDKSIPGLLKVPPQIWVFRDEAIEIADLDAAMIAALEHLSLPLDDLRGGRVLLGLQAPVDLCIAECMETRGASVSVVIGGSREQTVAHWQGRYGSAWSMRLARALDQAHEVSETPGFLASEPLWMRHAVTTRSMGLSLLTPEQIRSEWIGLTVVPQAAAPGFGVVALPASRVREIERNLLDVHCPLSEEPRMVGVRERRLCAVLVADFSSADELAEDQQPRFQSRVLAPFAAIVSDLGGKVLERKRWGSKLGLVCADAASASALALALRQLIVELDDDQVGTAKLGMRVLLHFGPAFVGEDPLAQGLQCYGSEVALVQSGVPSVPVGAVLATEAFAARLVLEAADTYRLSYVGEAALAAPERRCRLFGLQRDT